MPGSLYSEDEPLSTSTYLVFDAGGHICNLILVSDALTLIYI
jgi:hypothetical protein